MASFQVWSRQKFCLFAVILGPIRLTIGHQTLSQYSKLQPPELLPKKQRRIVGVEEGGGGEQMFLKISTKKIKYFELFSLVCAYLYVNKLEKVLKYLKSTNKSAPLKKKKIPTSRQSKVRSV
jgi:hypothetical protein